MIGQSVPADFPIRERRPGEAEGFFHSTKKTVGFELDQFFNAGLRPGRSSGQKRFRNIETNTLRIFMTYDRR
jgi:hypothetical protein